MKLIIITALGCCGLMYHNLPILQHAVHIRSRKKVKVQSCARRRLGISVIILFLKSLNPVLLGKRKCFCGRYKDLSVFWIFKFIVQKGGLT